MRHKFKKGFEIILTAGPMVKILSKVAQKIRLIMLVKIGYLKKNRLF